MATNDFICALNFDDLDLSSPDTWRNQMIDLVKDETFDSIMRDLSVTGTAIGAGPTARDWGGGCDVHGDVHSGGGASGGISCGIHF
ncbi:MAG: hypothetical protein V4564_11265 [Pseudomonadota bacterium]|uniref:hypothetical protein n=1 Tax=Sphingomonas sp. ERG5 TaxID=1381597 RepID=UPI00054B3657|nr:hypothetical protein [Sphingomonas sp. ERG5]